MDLTKQQETEAIDKWIQSTFDHAKRILPGFVGHSTSYGIKHWLERDTDIYMTNEDFKAAMLRNGFQPVDSKEQNWRFRVKLKK